MKKDLEEGVKAMIDFKKLKEVYEKVIKNGNPVIPVIVQDVITKQVLMPAFVNKKTLFESLKNKRAIFWSTSRNELWDKGEKSGNALDLVEILVNCEQNFLLFMVRPRNNCGACHIKDKNGNFRRSCFYRRVKNIDKLEFIV